MPISIRLDRDLVPEHLRSSFKPVGACGICYICHLVQIFREARRVLRDDGTLWLNIGDSYAGSWGNYAPHAAASRQRPRTKGGNRWERKASSDPTFLPPTAKPATYGLPPKNLIMIPARLALALQADGWILRSDVVWYKPNCLPESMKDRPVKAHEYVFLFAKSPRYYYDAQAIAEPAVCTHPSGNGFKRLSRLSYHNADGTARGSDAEWQPAPTRNRRTVWAINTEPLRLPHFAAMPTKLATLCVLAGSGPFACEYCGAPFRRVTEKEGTIQDHWAPGTQRKIQDEHARGRHGTTSLFVSGYHSVYRTIGWRPTCTCEPVTGTGRCIVLDPFCGAGTTPLVALQHGRAYVGIELHAEYVKLAERRIAVVQQHLWTTDSMK